MSFHRTSLQRLSDQQLLAALAAEAEVRRRSDARTAAISGEIARRSSPDRGHEGLAQRLGFRTPEKLIEATAQVSPQDAGVMVRVGGIDGPVADAVAAGELSLASADAIRQIERPDLEVQLIAEATQLPPKDLAIRARRLRDESDVDGIADREEVLRSRRCVRLTDQPDGMTAIHGLLNPELAAIVRSALGAVTSPRRPVRFVDPTAPKVNVADDPRTLEQVAVDGLVELIRLGTLVAPEELLGGQRPTVRVHVDAKDLQTGTGSGAFEGQTVPVSIQTVQRHACADGYIPIVFDPTGQPLDVGRDQRLYTSRQRIAMGARDGGCRFPGCDRPPSWCEAHHIVPWSRGGRTDVADGILLCRHHHLLIHNNGWQVTRDGSTYFVVPPRSIDPARTPRPAPARPRGSSSAAERRVSRPHLRRT